MSVCGGGGVLYNKNFFIVSLQPVAVVSIMHKSGESSVQCEGGRQPVPLRRLVFSSHSAENDKYSRLRVHE